MIELANATVLVAGVARNCEAAIEGDIARIGSALRSCPEVHWHIVESDSTDSTVAKLQGLEATIPNFRFTSLGALRPHMPLRTERLAHSRNHYLNSLRTDPIYRNVDYVVVADLDGINDLIDEKAILSCWLRDDWDVCTANQHGPYYDIWTLRHETWCPGDCWQERQFLIDHGVNPQKATRDAVFSRMITLQPDSPWLSVDSAFGGLAIYRRAALQYGQYVGLTPRGDEVSDHCALNAVLISKGYKIFINPSLINAGYTEHSLQLKALNRLKASVTNAPRTLVKRALGDRRTAFVRRALARRNSRAGIG